MTGDAEITRSGRIKRSILIVEDNEINREMLKGILEDHYSIIEAADGLEGLEKLRENFRSLSLVLLDVQMPRMNGYEFLGQYRRDKLLSSVPVIVTTGSTISEDEEKCLALGASDFVTKPYNPRVILRRIEAIIRLRESIATLQAVEYDSLTGLYNKSAFYHHVQNMLNQSDGGSFDMIMLNVEDFSYINERFGEATGDELLRHIGKRILEYDAKSTISCRINADRFILIRDHISCDHEKEAELFDQMLYLDSPIKDFSIKYAVYENIDTSLPIGVLCDKLTLTVKTIKHQYNKHVAYYDAEMSAKSKRLKMIADCMSDALADGQFKIFYQPKHNALNGRIEGAEALVRWIHPEYGFLSPGEFIPLFEENGFITNLDLYVWQTVCRNIREWQDDGISPVPVSVNASRRDFVTITDASAVLKPIEENGIDKKYLHVEITESLGIKDEIVLHKVNAIHDMGLPIELDDFGSGQSSLGTIRDIPMDVIKLDISFARAIEKQKEIVRMIISLSHALGLKTVAEGVETEAQIETLRELGCDMIQGYYYSKPLPEKDFREYLKNAIRT